MVSHLGHCGLFLSINDHETYVGKAEEIGSQVWHHGTICACRNLFITTYMYLYVFRQTYQTYSVFENFAKPRTYEIDRNYGTRFDNLQAAPGHKTPVTQISGSRHDFNITHLTMLETF